MSSYIYNVTCQNSDCVENGISYRVVDATDPTVCGACYGFVSPVKTDEIWAPPQI